VVSQKNQISAKYRLLNQSNLFVQISQRIFIVLVVRWVILKTEQRH